MRTTIVSLLLTALVGTFGCNIVRNPEAEAAAVDVAETWLTLVDTEQYNESWQGAAPLFRGAVSEEQWVETMQSLRKPLGKNLSREIKSIRYLTSLPGAPDGEYVLIQFRSSFDNKKSATETITPMRAEDGKWRVSGYFMK